MNKSLLLLLFLTIAGKGTEALALTGIVKVWNETKGWVIIKEDKTGKEYFSAVDGLIDHVVENDRVTFDTKAEKKGQSAVNIRLIPNTGTPAAQTPVPKSPTK